MAGGEINVWVNVQPYASRNEVLDSKNGFWRVKIAAPPVKGKANLELIEFLSEVLGINKNNLTIRKGLNRRRKLIGIGGVTTGEDAAQMIMAGAVAVGLGSALYYRGERVFSLPLTPYLTDEEVDDVIRAVRKIILYYSRTAS